MQAIENKMRPNPGGDGRTEKQTLKANTSLPLAQKIGKQTAQKLSTISLAQSAEQLAKRGLHIFPLSPKSKKPLNGSHGFKDATADLTKVKATWKASPECNIGVRTGTERDGKTLVVVDVDPRHDGDITRDNLAAEHGPLPKTLKAISGGIWKREGKIIRGEHYYFWAPSNLTYRKLGGIDIQAQNKYVVAPPSIHPDSGLAYEWVNASEEIADMPDWLVQKASQEKPRYKASAIFRDIASPDQLKDVKSALKWIPADYRPDWVRIGLALAGQDDEGYELWLEWSKKSHKFDEHEAEKTWATFEPEEINFVTVFFEAEKYGWVNPWRENTFKNLLDTIEANDLVGCEAGKLIDNVLQELAKVRLDATQEERVLKALKAETKTSLKALREELARIRQSLQPAGTFNLADATPTEAATAFFESEFVDGKPTLCLSDDDKLFGWNGAHYALLSPPKTRTEIFAFFKKEGVDITKVGHYDLIVQALKAQTYVEARPPCWLGDDDPPAPVDELLAAGNGILHLESGKLYPASPSFYNDYSVSFDYDPNAPEPKNWLTFLGQLFPKDSESIEALQQWFGYLLTRDTRYQKALMCVGPKRSGKGTIGRVWRDLLGHNNVTNPNITDLGKHFGMESLQGKALALISDAKDTKSADVREVAGNILRIVGEDSVSVGQKFKPNAEGRITARIVMFANLLPGLIDSGGALASRFIVLKFTQSFYGREDNELEKKLRLELPSILNWSLEGLRKLRKADRFLQPVSGEGALKELMHRSTPILAFIEDLVSFDADAWTPKTEVYAAYRNWVISRGEQFTLADNKFFNELYANSDGKLTSDRKPNKILGKRDNVVMGMRLNPVYAINAGDSEDVSLEDDLI